MSSIDRLKRTLNEAEYRPSPEGSGNSRIIDQRWIDTFADALGVKVVSTRGKVIVMPKRYSAHDLYFDAYSSDVKYALRHREIDEIRGFESVYLKGFPASVLPKVDADTITLKGASSLQGLANAWRPYGDYTTLNLLKCTLNDLSELNRLKFNLKSLTVIDCDINALNCSRLGVEEVEFDNISKLTSFSGLPEAEGITMSSLFDIQRLDERDFVGKVRALSVRQVNGFDESFAESLKEQGISVFLYNRDGGLINSFRPGWEPV